jgi:hypothetical protein
MRRRTVAERAIGAIVLAAVVMGSTGCATDRDRDDRRLRDDLAFAASRQQYVSPQELQGYPPPAAASPYGAPPPYPYPPQYAPPPGYAYPPPYPYPYPPQAAPQQVVVRERVVYRTVRAPATVQRAPQPAPVETESYPVSTTGPVAAGNGAGTAAGDGSGVGEGGGISEVIRRPNTRKGAVIGATSGAVIGAATSRDRFKGAVMGAILGGTAGGVIGSQVRTRERAPEYVRVSRPRGTI